MCQYYQWICRVVGCNNPISGVRGRLETLICARITTSGYHYRPLDVTFGWCQSVICVGSRKHGPNGSLCDSCLAKWQEDQNKKDKDKKDEEGAKDFLKRMGLHNPKEKTPPKQSHSTGSTSGGATGQTRGVLQTKKTVQSAGKPGLFGKKKK